MSLPENERRTVLAHIDQLLQEAYTLPRTPASWERRLHIDGELFQLFRRLAGKGAEEPRPVEALPHPAAHG